MEYSFKDHEGNEFTIIGEQVKKEIVQIGEGVMREYGPKCAVTIFETAQRGFIATIEFHPGVGNQALPNLKPWGGIIPRFERPRAETLEKLKLELIVEKQIGMYPNVGVEKGVEEAVKKLFPSSGPTVIR